MRGMLRIFLGVLVLATGATAGEWSEPANVMIETELCVTYRAKVDGDYLVVEAKPGEGWHVYAMDNELRSKKALAGKMSLGVDGPTQITLTGGLKPAGAWLQTEPHDYSKPDMRWYTWGYEDAATFATKVTGAGPTEIGIRGQACDATRCKNINVTLALPATKPGGKASLDLAKLIPVETE
jgi:hypothetical protein